MTDERTVSGHDPDPPVLVPLPSAVASLLNHDPSVTDDPNPAAPTGDWVRVSPWHFADPGVGRAVAPKAFPRGVARPDPDDQEAPTGL